MAVLALLLAGAAAAWAQPPRGETDYEDVDPEDWYYDHVQNLASAGILAGTDCREDHFCPRDYLPRWQMAVWLVRALEGEDPPDLEETRFDDVDADKWWAPHVDRLAELEITVGCSRDPLRYCPDLHVPRQQMASFLARAFDLPEADAAGFEDVGEGNVHAGSIDRLLASGITVGCSSEPLKFCPHRLVTRAHLAVFLSRALAWQAEREAEAKAGSSGGGGGGSSGGGGGSSGGSGGGGGGSQQPPKDDPAEPVGTPRNVKVTVRPRISLAVRWSEPQDDGQQPDSYELQWRLAAESFGPDRQLLIDADSDSRNLATRDGVFLVDLPERDAYEVRVTAVKGSQRSSVVALSPYSPQKLREVIDEMVINAYGDTHPWLRTTWAYIERRRNFLKTLDLAYLNTAQVEIGYVRDDPLDRHAVTGIKVRNDRIGEQYVYIYIHELAHVYTLANRIADQPAPLAIAHLYFQWLVEDSGAEPGDCRPEEFYADAIHSYVLAGQSGIPYFYWERDSECVGGATAPTSEAHQVVASALSGQMPGWLHATYQTQDGSLDLEALWTLVGSIHHNYFRTAVIYQLRDAFGGYCSPHQVREAASGTSTELRNPWRDGGCVPEAPSELDVQPGDGLLSVQWQPPAYDGGQSISSYIVQWRDSEQDYDAARQLETAASARAATIGELQNGVTYWVRVLAVNGHDDGDDTTQADGWGTPAEASSSPAAP